MNGAHPAHEPGQRVYYAVYAGLMLLLALTVAAAQFDVGPLNLVVAAGIAGIKALLILLFFMHVRYSRPLTWLVAGAAFFWLSILLGLTFADYWTRAWYSANHLYP